MQAFSGQWLSPGGSAKILAIIPVNFTNHSTETDRKRNPALFVSIFLERGAHFVSAAPHILAGSHTLVAIARLSTRR
jgi:hypothetical protein